MGTPQEPVTGAEGRTDPSTAVYGYQIRPAGQIRGRLTYCTPLDPGPPSALSGRWADLAGFDQVTEGPGLLGLETDVDRAPFCVPYGLQIA